ncbi:MAG: hypothetical protein U0936_08030 [Planctomycetaceae bacterium]
MESALILFFMGVMSLMLLGMLYGERLSMLAIFDGDWLGPIGSVFEKLWSGLVQGFDESLEFVLAHLSWVVAAASGTAGLVIIIFLMGGGLASDAAAYHRDTLTPLRSGGVIDKVPAVAARASQAPIILAKEDRDDSHLVSQIRTADYIVFGRPEYTPIRPRPRRPIDGSINYPPSSITDIPMLDVTFRRLGSSVIRSESNPDVITRGRLVDSLPDTYFIDRIVRRLRGDNWREALGLPGDDDLGLPQDNLPESPMADVEDLESRVKVTPGAYVSTHDLRVEKSVPEETASGDITIQVSLSNLGDKTIDGLLVREILPFDTVVRGASPNAVFRDDTLTWLVDHLRPADEYVLRFTVVAPTGFSVSGGRRSLFESLTEISAATAVAARTRVTDESPVVDPFPSERLRPAPSPLPRRETTPRRELAGSPSLRLAIQEQEEIAQVGEWTQVMFALTNSGTADAEAVRLRLILDESLDQPDLLRLPVEDRVVFVDVDRVAVGQTRRFRLEVRPNSSGETLSTAEVLLEGARVDRRTFRLVARDLDESRPRPENVIR